MTLMAGPIDTRVNPTKVNELAKSRPIEWFERHLISAVPWRFPGAFRHVYPGFMQLSAFMSMNLDRHISAHFGQFRSLVGGDHVSAEAHRRFYDEYGAVMDLPAEFYLETVQRVFQEHDLPRGMLTWHGQTVRPEAIRRMGLLTVEGERDDICAIGQTMAALDLCSADSGQPEAGPPADRRWALRRVQRPALGARGLSAGARDDPGDELRRGTIGSGCVGSRLMGFADCAHANGAIIILGRDYIRTCPGHPCAPSASRRRARPWGDREGTGLCQPPPVQCFPRSFSRRTDHAHKARASAFNGGNLPVFRYILGCRRDHVRTAQLPHQPNGRPAGMEARNGS